MAPLFVIGLPKGLAPRITSAAKQNGIAVEFILAGQNKEGKLHLIPSEATAIYPLENYTSKMEVKDVKILLLPYAITPIAIDEELDAIEECEGTVERVSAGRDGWPRLGESPDGPFLDSLFRAFEAKYFPKKAPTPSEHFTALAESNSRLLVTTGSLDTCDKVASHRRKFLISCADACIELLDQGNEETVEDFFRKRALDHAQSGGIDATLRIVKDGKDAYNETRNTHLKQGDKTTPQAAARVYYHYLQLEKKRYVGILYAGIHPSSNVSKIHHI